MRADLDESTVDGVEANGIDLVAGGLVSLGEHQSQTAVMQLITSAALACVPAASDSTLRVGIARPVVNRTSTSDLAMTVDALQDEHGGPSIDAAAAGHEDVFQIADFRLEHRWPDFAAAVTARTPMLSAVSSRLHIGRENDTIGSLSIYATKPYAFDADDARAIAHLCTYAAVVLAFTAEQDKTRNLKIALTNSRDIGTAIGILMARYLVTREQAFELLSSASQHTNRKIRDLTAEVIRTGDLSGSELLRARVRPDTAS